MLDVSSLPPDAVFALQFGSLVEHELVLRFEDLLGQYGGVPAVRPRDDVSLYSFSLGVLTPPPVLCEGLFQLTVV